MTKSKEMKVRRGDKNCLLEIPYKEITQFISENLEPGESKRIRITIEEVK